MVLLTLTALSFVWLWYAFSAWGVAVYNTDFQAFDRSLTPTQRDGIIAGTRQLMLIAAVPPVLLCVCWAVTATALLVREAPPADGHPAA